MRCQFFRQLVRTFIHGYNLFSTPTISTLFDPSEFHPLANAIGCVCVCVLQQVLAARRRVQALDLRRGRAQRARTRACCSPTLSPRGWKMKMPPWKSPTFPPQLPRLHAPAACARIIILTEFPCRALLLRISLSASKTPFILSQKFLV